MFQNILYLAEKEGNAVLNILCETQILSYLKAIRALTKYVAKQEEISKNKILEILHSIQDILLELLGKYTIEEPVFEILIERGGKDD